MNKLSFLFQQLVHRDFTQKYKRSILGMGWSVLSPLLTLLIMKVIFTEFFAKDIDHYTIYLFSGNIILSYYKEATKNGIRFSRRSTCQNICSRCQRTSRRSSTSA